VHSRAVGRAGILVFLAGMEFGFFFVLAEISYPGYSVFKNYISDLGATCSNATCTFVQPSSMLFNMSITVLGLLLLAASFYLWRGFRSRTIMLFAVLSGIGAMGVGVFNESFGLIHGIFSAWTFISTGIFAVLTYRILRRPMSYFSLGAGVITLVATALYVSGIYLGLGPGGMERMVVYPVLLWSIGFGGYLMAIGQYAEPIAAEEKNKKS
jgi:hypothetical membrane protein